MAIFLVPNTSNREYEKERKSITDVQIRRKNMSWVRASTFKYTNSHHHGLMPKHSREGRHRRIFFIFYLIFGAFVCFQDFSFIYFFQGCQLLQVPKYTRYFLLQDINFPAIYLTYLLPFMSILELKYHDFGILCVIWTPWKGKYKKKFWICF